MQIQPPPQEAEFLRSLNETLLANQRDFKSQLAEQRGRADAAEAAVKELQEQVGAAGGSGSPGAGYVRVRVT